MVEVTLEEISEDIFSKTIVEKGPILKHLIEAIKHFLAEIIGEWFNNHPKLTVSVNAGLPGGAFVQVVLDLKAILASRRGKAFTVDSTKLGESFWKKIKELIQGAWNTFKENINSFLKEDVVSVSTGWKSPAILDFITALTVSFSMSR